jgi:hypothetical protein
MGISYETAVFRERALVHKVHRGYEAKTLVIVTDSVSLYIGEHPIEIDNIIEL